MSEKDLLVMFTLGVPVTIGLIYALIVRYKDSHQHDARSESGHKD